LHLRISLRFPMGQFSMPISSDEKRAVRGFRKPRQTPHRLPDQLGTDSVKYTCYGYEGYEKTQSIRLLADFSQDKPRKRRSQPIRPRARPASIRFRAPLRSTRQARQTPRYSWAPKFIHSAALNQPAA